MSVIYMSENISVIQLDCTYCNCFLVKLGTYNVLVDTAKKEQKNLLLSSLKNYNTSSLDALILTHSHYDHVENGLDLQEIFFMPAYIEGSGISYVSNGINENIIGTGIHTKIFANLANAVSKKNQFRFNSLVNVYDIDRFSLGNEFSDEFTILKTPGHSLDSISLIFGNKVALVGDSIFNFYGMVYPPFAEDETEVLRSWEMLLETNCNSFYPGHGKVITREKLETAYKKRLRLGF